LAIAADTADVSEVGHVSEVLEETILLQIPFAGSVVPEHEVCIKKLVPVMNCGGVRRRLKD
jgi:hypothetical protein